MAESLLRDDVRAAAVAVFSYLAEVDPLPPHAVDAIVGFGVFDLSLPRHCADLYAAGKAPRIIFTGGVGAGTGNLGGAEADVWRAEVRHSHPNIGDEVFILENRSTNTAENIAFTAKLLAEQRATLAFGVGIRSVLIVASPSRLRRVRLTMQKLQPTVSVWRTTAAADFDRERALYARQGVDYLGHLAGEIERIVRYPGLGWIVEEPVPAEVLAAAERLRAAR